MHFLDIFNTAIRNNTCVIDTDNKQAGVLTLKLFSDIKVQDELTGKPTKTIFVNKEDLVKATVYGKLFNYFCKEFRDYELFQGYMSKGNFILNTEFYDPEENEGRGHLNLVKRVYYKHVMLLENIYSDSHILAVY